MTDDDNLTPHLDDYNNDELLGCGWSYFVIQVQYLRVEGVTWRAKFGGKVDSFLEFDV